MNCYRFLLCGILLLSCSKHPSVDERCYFKLSIDSEYYRSIGKGVGPFRELGELLFHQYLDNKRAVPPLAEGGELVFADECALLDKESYIDEIFHDTGFDFDVHKITITEYKKFASK